MLFSPGYRILYYSRFGRITVQEAITVTNKPFRVIDPAATGANILRLRKEGFIISVARYAENGMRLSNTYHVPTPEAKDEQLHAIAG